MLEEIEYDDVRFSDDPYHVRVYPVSALSNTPQGKLAQLNEMLSNGVIDVAEWRELYDMPDLDRSNDLAFAGRELSKKLVESALDGEEVAATRVRPGLPRRLRPEEPRTGPTQGATTSTWSRCATRRPRAIAARSASGRQRATAHAANARGPHARASHAASSGATPRPADGDPRSRPMTTEAAPAASPEAPASTEQADAATQESATPTRAERRARAVAAIETPAAKPDPSKATASEPASATETPAQTESREERIAARLKSQRDAREAKAAAEHKQKLDEAILARATRDDSQHETRAKQQLRQAFERDPVATAKDLGMSVPKLLELLTKDAITPGSVRAQATADDGKTEAQRPRGDARVPAADPPGARVRSRRAAPLSLHRPHRRRGEVATLSARSAGSPRRGSRRVVPPRWRGARVRS
jgi:hypothetical protein